MYKSILTLINNFFFIKLSKILLFFIFLGVLIPLVYLAFFNCPSVADDFCFSVTARDFGFWTAQKMYYDGWSGRYFANFLFHLNPLIFSENRIYFIIFPILLFIIFLYNIYTLLNIIYKKVLSLVTILLLSTTLFTLYCLTLPSINECFYWYSGIYTFVSANLVMFFFTLLIKNWQKEKSIKWHIILGSLLFLIIGSSEISMLNMILLLGAIAIYYYIFHKKISLFFITFIPVSIVGSYFVITASGNRVRQGSTSPDLWIILIKTGKAAIHFFLEWVIYSPLLLLCTMAFYFIIKNAPKVDGIFSVKPWFIILLFITLVYISFFPSTWGLGDITPPPRILNLIYLYFLFAWFYTISVLINYFSFKPLSIFPIIMPIFLLIFVFFEYKSKNFKGIYRDLVSGMAVTYLSEYEQRIKTIKSSTKDIIILEPLKTHPTCLYNEDLNNEPQHLWNRCQATYFHKKQIIVRPFDK